MTGRLLINSWAGLSSYNVDIIEETISQYKVRLLEDALLPRGRVKAGVVVWVPKEAVNIPSPLSNTIAD